MSKNHHLLQALQQLKQQPRPMVLATITETFGSTYQKAGARMLIAEDGELTGLLGGGCFEHDLVEHAGTVFATGIAKSLFYDMRAAEDAVWGLGMGCNGAVRIFLQLLREPEQFSPLNLIADAAENHQSGFLVTICQSEHADFPLGQSLFLAADSFGQASQPLRLSTPPEKSRLHTLSFGEQTVTAFYDRLQPPNKLLVLGAGADAIPLVDCAKALGWQVTVADHRPGYIDKQRLPQADRLLHSLPQELAMQLDLQQFSAAVLMTHNLDYDQRFLQAIAASAIGYIGLLGPVPRRERLLQGLGTAAESIRHRVYGPVGLDIGAETPAEIALSIMAGIQTALKSRSGLPLNLLKAGNVCQPE